VEQAQGALATVQKAIEVKHQAALAKQNEVIAPAENAQRVQSKASADAALEAAKNKLEADKSTKKAGEHAVHEAEVALKAAQKDAATADKADAVVAGKKATLDTLVATEYALLRDGTSAGPAGKKALARVLALGKEYGLGPTLLQTFPLTCKKAAADRSEFENMMFTQLQANIDKQLNALAQQLAEAEPVKAQKHEVVANAQNVLANAEAALTAATDQLTAAHAAAKEASKEVNKAQAHCLAIWDDMKDVCDAQDELGNELKNFKESILVAFQQLKEKEPEPEPVEELADPWAGEAVAADAAPAAEAVAA